MSSRARKILESVNLKIDNKQNKKRPPIKERVNHDSNNTDEKTQYVLKWLNDDTNIYKCSDKDIKSLSQILLNEHHKLDSSSNSSEIIIPKRKFNREENANTTLSYTNSNNGTYQNSEKRIKILSNVLIKDTFKTTSAENSIVPKHEPDEIISTPVNILENLDTKNTFDIYNYKVYGSPSSYENSIDSFGDDSIKDPNYSPTKSERLNFVVGINDTSRTCFNFSPAIMDINGRDEVKKYTFRREIEANPQTKINTKQTKNNEILINSIETTNKKHYNDKFNYCFYCEKDVTHFVRHILTWHSTEITVQQISCLPTKSKERRNLISSLRKKGNFLQNTSNEVLRPVKRINSQENSQKADFLPCSHCLGFYKRKCLYRHTKICAQNQEHAKIRQTSQSDGQTTLLLGKITKYHKILSKELFPRMRADDINLIAKQDILICQYAYSYIKGRKSKGNIDFVRQNVRRLAKFLIFCRKKNSNLKDLMSILRPLHFELILEAVNNIAKYNEETDTYESPTLAMNFGTLLKKCCDLAYIHLIQIENTNDQRKDLKILKKIMESQWADEISAQAGLNLNENKWNKNELLPLTSDLKKLGIYLQNVAREAYKKLQLNRADFSAYTELKEVVYTQIILLNRRRPAEVAQLKVEKYNTINKIINETKENTEFENCLTETEKILLKSYSRIVIRGKRGRGVPILFSLETKQHFDYFVSIRNEFIKENEYVFHTNGKGFIDGTRVIYKYAIKCGVDKPKTITATKLRKHLATITQLLQFNDKDLEQLSKFMGHTLNTHCKVYRLSDSMYQTAKVSKLLLLMGDGDIEQYKGKTLDEIDLNLEPIVEEDNLLNKIMENEEEDVNDKNQKDQKDKEIVQKKPIIKYGWTNIQKKTISDFFSEHIQSKKAPKQREVNELVTLYPDLFQDKKWTSIKSVVYNMYTGKLKYY